MARITNLSSNNGTGIVSLPKDELEVCGLLEEDESPDTDIQLIVTMESPGEWRVAVLDESCVDDSWYTERAAESNTVTGGPSTRK